MTILSNANAPLASLAVADRPYEAWHPSIIDFQTEHGLAQWPKTGQGWRFWCGITTGYPEDCYLFVSNDGANWQPAPHHASQPNAPNATQPTNSYVYGEWGPGFEDWITPNFSDDEIIYDPIGDRIMVYYVDEGGAEPGGLRTVSNSLLLSAPIRPTLWDGAGANAPAGMWAGMSPTVIREDATHYHHYSVAVLSGTPDQYDIAYVFSTDGINPTGPWRLCTHGGLTGQLPNVYAGLHPWHIKAKANQYVYGQMEIVLTTLQFYNIPYPDDRHEGSLVHLRTTFANPSEWSAPFAPQLLLSQRLPYDTYWAGHETDPDYTSPYFDGFGLYRSDFVLQKSGSNLVMQLWYNGMNLPRPQIGTGEKFGTDPKGQIGFTSGTLQSNVTWVDKPADPIIQFTQQPFASAFTSNGFTVNYGTADIVTAILGVAAQTQSSQLQALVARTLMNCISSSSQTAQLESLIANISQSGNVQQLGASQLESIIAKVSIAGNVQSVQLSQTESAFYGALIGALSSIQSPQIESAIAGLSQCGIVTSTQRVQLETIRNLLAMLGLVTNPRIKNVTPVRSFKDLSN